MARALNFFTMNIFQLGRETARKKAFEAIMRQPRKIKFYLNAKIPGVPIWNLSENTIR